MTVRRCGGERSWRPGKRPLSTAQHIDIDRTACQGHGLCADFLPEHIALDERGCPLVDGAPVPAGAVQRARRAAADCPVLALKLIPGRAG
ncbi:ferredoxin [Streptomyces sp. 3330]|uniref:ferredoxin n=1 Tax=Streptomyces sp. 3330 TaxID=2817755 RepID=UPI00286B75AC|nr:ferredoxin [Streptomyces sp. 3330]